MWYVIGAIIYLAFIALVLRFFWAVKKMDDKIKEMLDRDTKDHRS
jgi:hypothetical protein